MSDEKPPYLELGCMMWLLVYAIVVLVLFTGEPDIQDALIHYSMK